MRVTLALPHDRRYSPAVDIRLLIVAFVVLARLFAAA
jgi:hypothetical protein